MFKYYRYEIAPTLYCIHIYIYIIKIIIICHVCITHLYNVCDYFFYYIKLALLKILPSISDCNY